MTTLTILGKRWRLRFVRGLLRRKGLLGECDHPETPNKEIRIDSQLRGKAFVAVLVHEILHAGDWHKDEAWVDRMDGDLTTALYHKEVLKRWQPNVGTRAKRKAG